MSNKTEIGFVIACAVLVAVFGTLLTREIINNRPPGSDVARYKIVTQEFNYYAKEYTTEDSSIVLERYWTSRGELKTNRLVISGGYIIEDRQEEAYNGSN